MELESVEQKKTFHKRLRTSDAIQKASYELPQDCLGNFLGTYWELLRYVIGTP
jgi:hypothetical protein